MWRDEASLLDMLEACRSLVRISAGLDYQEYLSNEDLKRLSERYFEILGEAANRISSEYQDFHPEIPWSAWIGLRHVVVHQYHKIDYARLWELMTVAVPELIELLEPIAPPENP
jgi:uncharacterized protein with HEPN domain